MKKILIIEDDPILANIYRNKLTVDGYRAEVAPDGETGLKTMRTFQPELIVLDLMLPGLSGVEVIKQIRSETDFEKTPIIVFSNTYLTNVIQEAWRAGASKCLSKSNCSPKEFVEVVRLTIGNSGAIAGAAQPGAASAAKQQKAAPTTVTIGSDEAFQTELLKTFTAGLPGTLYSLRTNLQSIIKAENEVIRLKQIYELYRIVHALNGNAGLAGLLSIAHMASAFEALLKELYDKPKNINPSTLRTVAAAVDFLGILFEKANKPGAAEISSANILVVDDEAISRRAIVYALEKAQLKSTNIEHPEEALKLLSSNNYDLIFLDVLMPEMNGYELCAKLRALPHHKKTPVVFVTGLTDFNSKTDSMMAGGNDFIGKPFLFIELTVKALIHIQRAKLLPQKKHDGVRQ